MEYTYHIPDVVQAFLYVKQVWVKPAGVKAYLTTDLYDSLIIFFIIWTTMFDQQKIFIY